MNDSLKILEDQTKIASYDPGGMLAVIEAFPRKLEEAIRIGRDFRIPSGWGRNVKQIVFAGVGGSAIGADVIVGYTQRQIGCPVMVNRGYTLPQFVGPETLLVVSSYSGNTEETISSYKDGKDKKAAVIAISSGGEVEKMAKACGDPHIKIPAGFPPRMAIEFLVIPGLLLLEQLGLIKLRDADFAEAVSVVRRLRDSMNPAATSGNEAKELAVFLHGKYPLFYSAMDHFEALALRWRGQVEENAKVLATHHVLPEMNHNEIMGWENQTEQLGFFAPVFLRDAEEHPRVRVRMKITQELIRKRGVLFREVYSEGDSLLARIFSLIYKADYMSFYLAVLYGANPIENKSIDYLKKQLADKKD